MAEGVTRLSVNINKLATLRNARGGHQPDLAHACRYILERGDFGITVHPRPDERHIRYQDVIDLRPLVTTEFNVEGYPSEKFAKLIEQVRPDQVTLVPDPPHVLTSDAGWEVWPNRGKLQEVIAVLGPNCGRISLFIDPQTVTEEDLAVCRELGVARIELYTEAYAQAYGTDRQEEVLARYQKTSSQAQELGLEINAGHDLNQENLGYFLDKVPGVREVSIGHALICESIYQGLEETLSKYQALCSGTRPSASRRSTKTLQRA